MIFFDVKNYKIENNGIWISKEDLDHLREKYDNEYTKVYNAKSMNTVLKAKELTKRNTQYHIAKELSNLINNG